VATVTVRCDQNHPPILVVSKALSGGPSSRDCGAHVGRPEPLHVELLQRNGLLVFADLFFGERGVGGCFLQDGNKWRARQVRSSDCKGFHRLTCCYEYASATCGGSELDSLQARICISFGMQRTRILLYRVRSAICT